MAWKLSPISEAGLIKGAISFNDISSFYSVSVRPPSISSRVGYLISGYCYPTLESDNIFQLIDGELLREAVKPLVLMSMPYVDNETQEKKYLVYWLNKWSVENDECEIVVELASSPEGHGEEIITRAGGLWARGVTGTYIFPQTFKFDGSDTYIGLSTLQLRPGENTYHWAFNCASINLRLFAEKYGQIEEEEESPEFGPASGEGGYSGTFDDSSDTIGLPEVPAIGVTSAGFVNVYRPEAGELEEMGKQIFPEFIEIDPYTPTGSDVVDAVIDVANAISNFCANIPNMMDILTSSVLINYIIDCHIIPVAPAITDKTSIKVGFKTLEINANKVTSDYIDFDCGTIHISEYYGNFIDYAPYTSAKLFLPFVGFVDVEPELFQSGELSVVYRFNIIDGSFMAFVISSSSKSKLSGSIVAQYGGNACVHIPITGANYSNMVSGIAAGALGIASSASVGSVAGMVSAAVDTATAAPKVQSSNGYNATTSFLGVRRPYLLIERSVSHFSTHYNIEEGLPSYISSKLGALHGFTQADSIHVDGIVATEAERQEIARLLAQGVIL